MEFTFQKMVLFCLFMTKLFNRRHKDELLFAFFYGDATKIKDLDRTSIAFRRNRHLMRTCFHGDSRHLEGIRQEERNAEVRLFELALGDICTNACKEVN